MCVCMSVCVRVHMSVVGVSCVYVYVCVCARAYVCSGNLHPRLSNSFHSKIQNKKFKIKYTRDFHRVMGVCCV